MSNFNSNNHSFQWNTKPINTTTNTFNKYHAPTYSSSSSSSSSNGMNTAGAKPNNNGVCSNCGKYGHFSYQCNHPTVSYGMIVYRRNRNQTQNQNEYLMICRKDSFGYVDFIRGKYSLSDMDHVRHIFREMSEAEHEKIAKAEHFNELWCDLWNIPFIKNSHKHEERVARKKYDTLKEDSTLDAIINESSKFKDAEWEFPKGRKEFNEGEMECALREFEEETGLNKSTVQIVDNLVGLDENYVGSNYAAYKHRYFLAEYVDPTSANTETSKNALDTFQKTEVGKLEWKTLDQCLADIRPYHLEKKHILKNMDEIINKYVMH